MNTYTNCTVTPAIRRMTELTLQQIQAGKSFLTRVGPCFTVSSFFPSRPA